MEDSGHTLMSVKKPSCLRSALGQSCPPDSGAPPPLVFVLTVSEGGIQDALTADLRSAAEVRRLLCPHIPVVSPLSRKTAVQAFKCASRAAQFLQTSEPRRTFHRTSMQLSCRLELLHAALAPSPADFCLFPRLQLSLGPLSSVKTLPQNGHRNGPKWPKMTVKWSRNGGK